MQRNDSRGLRAESRGSVTQKEVVEGEEGGALNPVEGLDGLIARRVIGRAVQKEVTVEEASETGMQGDKQKSHIDGNIPPTTSVQCVHR